MKDDKSIQNLCLHTHNIFCDGKENIKTLINNAIILGINQFGISSHAPLKFPNKWSMNYDKLDEYRNVIRELKMDFEGRIQIFTSLEIDYIPNKTYSFDFFREKLSLDYTIGSIHLVQGPKEGELWFIDGNKENCISQMNQIFSGNVKHAVQQYYLQTREMVSTQQPDIVGHLDKVVMNTGHLFDTSEKWYQEEIKKTLEVIRANSVIVEANTRGIYKGKWKETFPSHQILQECFNMGVPVIISSDAHESKELLLGVEETRAVLKKIGYRFQQGRDNSKWGNIPI